MTAADALVIEELRARRNRLAAVGEEKGENLLELLRRVDSVLSKLENPDWGVCSHCHEEIESAPLGADDLVHLCLDCFSPDERRGLEADLKKAARVQQGLLPPRQLNFHGWEVAWLWEPRGAVSGDHVDLLVPQCDEDTLHLMFGDVVGKGVSASLLQSHLHALFRGLAEADLNLGDMMTRANRVFCEATVPASYASLIGAKLHRNGILEMANAGHPRPLLADQRGVRPIEGSGLPLGLFPDSSYSPREMQLAPGHTVLLYTDGLTEAENEHGEYGIGRAAAALRKASGQSLGTVLQASREDLRSFLEDRPNSDDLTLLAIRRLPQ